MTGGAFLFVVYAGKDIIGIAGRGVWDLVKRPFSSAVALIIPALVVMVGTLD